MAAPQETEEGGEQSAFPPGLLWGTGTSFYSSSKRTCCFRDITAWGEYLWERILVVKFPCEPSLLTPGLRGSRRSSGSCVGKQLSPKQHTRDGSRRVESTDTAQLSAPHTTVAMEPQIPWTAVETQAVVLSSQCKSICPEEKRPQLTSLLEFPRLWVMFKERK